MQARRLELGFQTKTGLAEAADLSGRIVGAIERAERDSYSPSTLWKLDRALQWERGSSQALLERNRTPEPTPTVSLLDRYGPIATLGFDLQMRASEELAEAFRSGRTDQLADSVLLVGVSTLLGGTVGDFDLLTEVEYAEVLNEVRTTYESAVKTRQSSKPEYASAPCPSGFTRLQIDWAKQQLLERGDDTTNAVHYLASILGEESNQLEGQTAPAPNPAHDLGPSGLPFEGRVSHIDIPDFTQLAARTVTRRPGWDASQVGTDAGEEPQD